MTDLEVIEKEFNKKISEVKEKCQSARETLKEKGFLGTDCVKAKVFQEVFEDRWSYSIHDLQIMNISERENGEKLLMQIMVQFEDSETEFVYLIIK